MTGSAAQDRGATAATTGWNARMATRSQTEGASRSSIARELVLEQIPLFLLLLGLGVWVSQLQHGFVAGLEGPFPVAGVDVPIWHLVWMGAWTGYIMAMVGEASGILALPYSMSVLQFSSAGVTPSVQLLSLLNPVGALVGFHRSRQWNRDLAFWACLGAVPGGLIGPFVRWYVLLDASLFTLAVGLALGAAGLHLGWAGVRRWRRCGPKVLPVCLPPSETPRIVTERRDGASLTVSYDGRTFAVDLAGLFAVGVLVAIVSTALGVGGGFLMVPFCSLILGLPMYVLVAATIPYVIVLSALGLLTYAVIMPAALGTAIEPEWAWGFYAAAGGTIGAWTAAKSQRFVPEHNLKLLLGGLTLFASVLYLGQALTDLLP